MTPSGRHGLIFKHCCSAYTLIINPEIFEDLENSERVEALP
jgi:hypothetical protein